MSRYGVTVYGSDTYGDVNPATLSTQLVLREHDYTTIRVTLAGVPTGVYDGVAIVRSTVGDPEYVTDGVLLYEQDSRNGSTSLQIRQDLLSGLLPVYDSGLVSGTWAYYAVFLYVARDAEWVRVATDRRLVPFYYAGADALYQSIPPIFRTDLHEAVDDPTLLSNPVLKKFLGIFGFQSDILRSQTASLADVRDAKRMAYQLVAPSMEDFGVPFEQALGAAQNRKFLDNAVYFYKTKGSLRCARGVSKAVTGYGAEVTIGNNLLYTKDDSQALSVGSWVSVDSSLRVVADTTLDLGLSGTLSFFRAIPAANKAVSTGVFLMGVTTPVTYADGPDTPTLETAQPVHPNQNYGVAASFFGVAGGTVAVQWLDIKGHAIGGVGAPAGGGYGAGGYGAGGYGGAADVAVGTTLSSAQTVAPQRIEQQFTAPANAAYAVPGVSAQTVAGLLWTAVQFNALSATAGSAYGASGYGAGGYSGSGGTAVALPPYEAPRKVKVRLLPPRTNLVPNPSFEADLNGWAQIGGQFRFAQDSVVRDVGQHGSEQASALLQSTQDISPTSPLQMVYIPLQTTVGARYAVRIRFQRTSTLGGASFLVGAFAQVNVPSPIPLGSATVTGTDQEFFADAPPFAFRATGSVTYLGVQLLTLLRGAQINIDSCLVERTDRQATDLGAYFDGDTFSIYGENVWAGTPKDSTSMQYPQRSIRVARLQEILPRYLPYGTDFEIDFGLPAVHAYADPVKIIGHVPPPVATATVTRAVSLVWNNTVRNGSAVGLAWNLIAHAGRSEYLAWTTRSLSTKSISPQWRIDIKPGVSVSVRWTTDVTVGSSLSPVWKTLVRPPVLSNSLLA